MTINSLLHTGRLIALASLSAFVGNCPHQANAPIAESSTAALDARMPGVWRCVSPGDDESALITIRRATATEFVARWVEANNDTLHVRLFSAKSGKTPLVNAQAGDASDELSWALLQMSLLRPDVLEIRIANGAPFDSAGNSATRDVVGRALKQGTLFGRPILCVRDDT